MTTRQQRRAQERRPDQPSGRYSPDFLEGVAILNRLDPIRLRMAVAALEALETKRALDLVGPDAIMGKPSA